MLKLQTQETATVATFEVGSKEISFEIGELAMQAGGAVLVRCHETAVLVTATSSAKPREGIDFFPLLVDYEEKLYSVGRIPGSYFRREGRAPMSATLIARLIDRPIRPLFPQGYRNDVQIVATPLSVDQEIQPDILAMLGASVALSVSDIPFLGPIAAVRVGRIDGQWLLNPTFQENDRSDMEVVVAGTRDAVLMVEAGAKFVPESDILEAIRIAHEEIQRIVRYIAEIQQRLGKPKQEVLLFVADPDLSRHVNDFAAERFREALHHPDPEDREKAMSAAKEAVIKHLDEELPPEDPIKQTYLNFPDDLDSIFHDLEKKLVREMVLNEGRRLDGRAPTEVRPIGVKVGWLPRVHGSALFTRGTTQAMSVVTLGSMNDAQELDGIEPDEVRRYMHHYNFPAFSVGEVRPMRGPGRRDIGHGALAERAILPTLPAKMEFPYTIRVVSEILSSNGSTSMASTCGSCLALMDAGVPIPNMVGGVAMGLIKEEDRHVVLTDILGSEDHLGDMDFKVAGSAEGVTALQMDIKIRGISLDILREALEQARAGRLHILAKMAEVIDKPRPDLSKYAPRIESMQIPVDKIGDLIGPGGKNVKRIVEETGAKIDIGDDGTVQIVSNDPEAQRKAKEWVMRLTREAKEGEVYTGKVTKIASFGAFVEIFPGKEGLVHINQLPGGQSVRRVEDVVRVGTTLNVRVREIDTQGRVNLTCLGLPQEGLPELVPGEEGAPRHHPPRRDQRDQRHRRPPRRSPV